MQPFHRIRKFYAQVIIILLIAGSLASCFPQPKLFPLPQQTFEFPEHHRLVIQLDRVKLEISGSSDHLLHLSGSSAATGLDLQLVSLDGSEASQLSFNTTNLPAAGELMLKLEIPTGTHIEVEQMQGDIFVHDISGSLNIDSISANIRIERFSGNLRAVSRRGRIQIDSSEGDIRALAEADTIEFTGVNGQISGTNIIGNIILNGAVGDGDSAHLETDHGDVLISLREGSDLMIDFTSAGGFIVCTLPGMSGTFRSCAGQVGKGLGRLNIRTVSGAIRIDQAP